MRLEAKYLASTTTLTAVENKILILFKKTDCNKKNGEIEKKKNTDDDHDKYITTSEVNKVTAEYFAVRLAQANLANKNDIVKKNEIKKNNKKADFDDKLKN